MTAPFDVIVQATFQEVEKFINGDGQVFGMAVMTAGLAFHALLGGAELVTGQPSRLTKGTFWVRIVFVGVLLASFDTIFLSFTKSIISNSLGDIIPSWIAIWKGFFATAMQNFSDGMKFSASGASASIGAMIGGTINQAIIMPFMMGASLLVTIIALICILLNAIFGLGASALVVAFAPICIPFGIHEATEDIAKSYFKTWLAYSVVYLPLLTIAMRIAVAMQGPLFSVMTQMAPPESAGDAFSQSVALMIGPLGALGLVMAAPMVVKNILK